MIPRSHLFSNRGELPLNRGGSAPSGPEHPDEILRLCPRRHREACAQPRSTTLVDPYPSHPEPSLSLPIRMEKKRKRTKAGVAAEIVGAALLSAGIYNFTRSGSELIAVYLTVMAVGLLVVGLSVLLRSAKTS
jgi:hypothetical protein